MSILTPACTVVQSTVMVVDNPLIPLITGITDDFDNLADALTELQVIDRGRGGFTVL